MNESKKPASRTLPGTELIELLAEHCGAYQRHPPIEALRGCNDLSYQGEPLRANRLAMLTIKDDDDDTLDPVLSARMGLERP